MKEINRPVKSATPSVPFPEGKQFSTAGTEEFPRLSDEEIKIVQPLCMHIRAIHRNAPQNRMNKGWTILISSSDGLGNSSVPAVENCLPSGNGTDGVVDLTGRLISFILAVHSSYVSLM